VILSQSRLQRRRPRDPKRNRRFGCGA
jgi:hypothetical protein